MKKKMWIGMKGSRWKEILLLWGGFSKLTVDLRCSVVVMFGSKIRSWEKERRRSTWDREKREGKGAPERQRKRRWETNGFLGISGLGSEGKVARSDLFSGVRLSFYLGLWSKLMWLFWTEGTVYRVYFFNFLCFWLNKEKERIAGLADTGLDIFL